MHPWLFAQPGLSTAHSQPPRPFRSQLQKTHRVVADSFFLIETRRVVAVPTTRHGAYETLPLQAQIHEQRSKGEHKFVSVALVALACFSRLQDAWFLVAHGG